MSLRKDLNITEELMARYSPWSQLSAKYREQVLKNSSVVTFDEGEQVFDKEHELHSLYYLLKGTLKAKKGWFSSETLEASSSQCFNPINNKIPNGVGVKATTKGYMLLVDSAQLDRALGWSVAEQDKLTQSKEEASGAASPSNDDVPLGGDGDGFDEDHFAWITSLMEFPLFFNLPPSNMELLLTKFKKIPVADEQVIIQEGDEGDYFYLLMDGSASVVIGGDESRPIRLNKGSYFGEEALISDTVRSATVIMNADGLLARLDKESFQSLLSDPLVSHVSYRQYLDEAKADTNSELLDIRSFTEFEHAPLPKCMHIPLAELRQKIPTLDTSKVYYLTEEGGTRSDVAAHILCQSSFKAKVIRG